MAAEQISSFEVGLVPPVIRIRPIFMSVTRRMSMFTPTAAARIVTGMPMTQVITSTPMAQNTY